MGNFREGLPNDYEAESAVLSAMLIDTGACVSALSELLDGDFYHATTRAVFAAIQGLYRRNEPIDVVMVSRELEASDKLKIIGGISGLAAILSGASTSVHVRSYIGVVKELAKRREVIAWARSVEESAYGAESIDEVAEIAANTPKLYGESKERGTMDILHETVTDVCERYRDDGRELPGMPTGIEALDKATDGLYPGEVIYLCADPGVGKSLLLTQILVNKALRGVHAAYFNYELSDAQIGKRILSSAMPIETRKLNYPREHMRDEDFNVFRKSDIDVKLDPFLHIFSRTHKTAPEILARCKELELRGKKPAVIGVDYIQIMRGKGRDGREIIENNSAALKAIAEEFECPVIVVSSLNRGNGGGKEKGIRNSAQLEYDAGRIVLLERDHQSPNKAERCKTTVKMLKNRDGAAGEFTLVFDESYLRFL